MPGAHARKRKVVDALIAMHLRNFKTSGTALNMEQGRSTALKTLEVKLNDGQTRVLSGKRIIVSAGSRASIDHVPGLPEAKPLTHVEALELD